MIKHKIPVKDLDKSKVDICHFLPNAKREIDSNMSITTKYAKLEIDLKKETPKRPRNQEKNYYITNLSWKEIGK
jgi:hypothetical protein